MDVLFYISSHGYGHAARQQSLIRRLAAAGVRVHVRSAAPAKFFAAAATHEATYYDIGLIQHDPLRYEISATADWYEAFLRTEPAMIAREAAYGRQHNIRLVLSDMAPIAADVAVALGLDCLVMTHFTWDWVYEYYSTREPRFVPIVDHIQAQYGRATLALQMPFAHPFPQFQQVQPVGLFVNAPTRTRSEVRAQFAVPPDHRLALLSMGGHDWGQTDLRALAAVTGWTFLVMASAWSQVSQLPFCRPVPADFPAYHNLLAAADLVIGKAGGSTVAQVLAYPTPLLYTLSDDWRESDLLHTALQSSGYARWLSLADFERGAWVQLLDETVSLSPSGVTWPGNGTAQASAHILTHLQPL